MKVYPRSQEFTRAIALWAAGEEELARRALSRRLEALMDGKAGQEIRAIQLLLMVPAGTVPDEVRATAVEPEPDPVDATASEEPRPSLQLVQGGRVMCEHAILEAARNHRTFTETVTLLCAARGEEEAALTDNWKNPARQRASRDVFRAWMDGAVWASPLREEDGTARTNQNGTYYADRLYPAGHEGDDAMPYPAEHLFGGTGS